MEKRITRYMLIALAAILLHACNRQRMADNGQLISLAAAVTNENPDSALLLLEKVDTTLLGESLYAGYVLACVQAKDKADRTIEADTAIFGAYDYFVAAGDNEKAALACFYSGRVYQERGDTDKALTKYLDAGRMAQWLNGSDHLKGLIQFKIGEIYYLDTNPEKVVERFRSAAAHFKAAKQPAKEIRAIHSIGASYLVNERFDSALYYFNKVSAMPAFEADPALQTSVMQNIGLIARYTGEPEKARELFSQALQQATNDHTKARLYAALAKAYRDLGIRDSASFCVEQALSLCRKIEQPFMVAVYEILAEMEKDEGNYDMALEYTQTQLEYEREVFEKSESKRLAEIEQKYNYRAEQNEKEKLALRVENMWLLVIAIIAGSLALILGGIMFVRRLVVRKNKKISQLSQDIDEARKKAAELQDAIACNREIIRQLEQEKVSAAESRKSEIDTAIGEKTRNIGQLLEEIRMSYVYTLKAYMLVYDKFEIYMQKRFDKKKDKEFLDRFEGFMFGKNGVIDWEIISAQLPENLENNIRTEYALNPGIRKGNALDATETRICCLKLFEVSNYHIAKILNLKEGSLYTKNSYIKRKLGLTKVEDVQETLKYLLDR